MEFRNRREQLPQRSHRSPGYYGNTAVYYPQPEQHERRKQSRLMNAGTRRYESNGKHHGSQHVYSNARMPERSILRKETRYPLPHEIVPKSHVSFAIGSGRRGHPYKRNERTAPTRNEASRVGHRSELPHRQVKTEGGRRASLPLPGKTKGHTEYPHRDASQTRGNSRKQSTWASPFEVVRENTTERGRSPRYAPNASHVRSVKVERRRK